MDADPDLRALHDLALDIAREAGRLQMDALHGVRTVEAKSSPTDAVTEVDRACEALIVRRILEARPDDSILGEEGADHTGASGVRWVIDPLDGTVNYLYRRGAFAVSLGIEVDGQPAAGAVFDPSRDEMFSAVRGAGAWLNGAPIRASDASVLGWSLIGTGFGYEEHIRRAQGATLAEVIPQVRDIRRAGSAALDVCAVACGRLDGYYERGVQAWDIAAAAVIVQEAGGLAERLGTPEVPAGTWVAGAPGVFAQLRAAVVAASQAPGTEGAPEAEG
ncbi:MAG: inositol monophosphatase family protein [Dehalococcoidia bacterium]